MKQNDEIRDQLPLTEATFFILLSLSSGKKHGYAIMKDVERLSDGRVSMSTGTLYGALTRMLDQGWIERVDEPQQGARPRNSYVLSGVGTQIMQAETERLMSLVQAAGVQVAGRNA